MPVPPYRELASTAGELQMNCTASCVPAPPGIAAASPPGGGGVAGSPPRAMNRAAQGISLDQAAGLLAGSVTKAEALWKYETGKEIYSSPCPGPDGTVYVGSNDHKLYAIGQDGEKRWEVETGGLIYSSPCLGPDGTVYVGSNDHKLYAIGQDGKKRWEFETGGTIQSSPCLGPDGTVYMGSYDGKLYAIDQEGRKRWEFKTGGLIQSSPCLSPDGTVYAGSYDHKLYAVHLPARLPALGQEAPGTVAGTGPELTIGETYIEIEGVKLPVNKAGGVVNARPMVP